MHRKHLHSTLDHCTLSSRYPSAMSTHPDCSGIFSAEYAGVIICQEVDWEYPSFSRRHADQESVDAQARPSPPNEGGSRSNDVLARRRDAEHSLVTSIPPVINSNLNFPNDSEIFYFPRSPEYAAYPLHRRVVFNRGNTKGLSLWRVRAADIMGVDFVDSPMSCAITIKPYQTTIRLLFDVGIVFSVLYLKLTRSFNQWPLPPGQVQERPRHLTHTRVVDIGTFNSNPHKKNKYMRTACLARGVAYTVQEEIYALLRVTPKVRPAHPLRARILTSRSPSPLHPSFRAHRHTSTSAGSISTVFFLWDSTIIPRRMYGCQPLPLLFLLFGALSLNKCLSCFPIITSRHRHIRRIISAGNWMVGFVWQPLLVTPLSVTRLTYSHRSLHCLLCFATITL